MSQTGFLWVLLLSCLQERTSIEKNSINLENLWKEGIVWCSRKAHYWLSPVQNFNKNFAIRNELHFLPLEKRNPGSCNILRKHSVAKMFRYNKEDVSPYLGGRDPEVGVSSVLGSGAFLTPGSGIQNRFFPFPESQTHIFESLVTIFGVKSSIILWKLAQIFFFSISKIK